MEAKNLPIQMPSFDLTGKVAIVTGGTKGLGYAMSLTLAYYGAKVVVSSRNQEECDKIVEEIENMNETLYGEKDSLPRAIGVRADVINKDDLDELVKKAVDTFGRLDIMVNNAGMGITKKVIDMSVEEWDTVLNTNLRGVFFGAAAAAKQMINQGVGGRIINISSAGGLVGTKNIAAYCASKSGVISLSKTMAMEWGRYGITANSICPGYVPTSINSKPLEIPKVREQILSKTALKRLGTIEEIAAVVLFLASDASSIITGACIAADMGTTAN